MKYLSYSILITIIVACSGGSTQGDQDDLKSLKEEVMAVHDEVMPKMGALMKAKKQLLKKAENETDSLKILKLMTIANEIEVANESMMDWMHNYDPNFDGNEEAVKKYLNQKKNDIDRVKSDMLSSLLAGEEALKSE